MATQLKKVNHTNHSEEHQTNFTDHLSKAKKFYELALQVSTNNLENYDSIKINLIIKVTEMFYSVYDEKKSAISMAQNYLALVPNDKMKIKEV